MDTGNCWLCERLRNMGLLLMESRMSLKMTGKMQTFLWKWCGQCIALCTRRWSCGAWRTASAGLSRTHTTWISSINASTLQCRWAIRLIRSCRLTSSFEISVHSDSEFESRLVMLIEVSVLSLLVSTYSSMMTSISAKSSLSIRYWFCFFFQRNQDRTKGSQDLLADYFLWHGGKGDSGILFYHLDIYMCYCFFLAHRAWVYLDFGKVIRQFSIPWQHIFRSPTWMSIASWRLAQSLGQLWKPLVSLILLLHCSLTFHGLPFDCSSLSHSTN